MELNGFTRCIYGVINLDIKPLNVDTKAFVKLTMDPGGVNLFP